MFRGLAPSSSGLTGKPYAFGPFVVELFAASAFFRGRRALSNAQTRPLAGVRFPTPARVRGRVIPSAGPWTGFAPALRHRGLDSLVLSPGMSLSPLFRGEKRI